MFNWPICCSLSVQFSDTVCGSDMGGGYSAAELPAPLFYGRRTRTSQSFTVDYLFIFLLIRSSFYRCPQEFMCSLTGEKWSKFCCDAFNPLPKFYSIRPCLTGLAQRVSTSTLFLLFHTLVKMHSARWADMTNVLRAQEKVMPPDVTGKLETWWGGTGVYAQIHTVSDEMSSERCQNCFTCHTPTILH